MWFISMSAFRPILKVLRNISCLWLNDMYNHCKHIQCWEWKCVSGIFLRSGGKYSTKGRSVSNCREDENMFLSPCTKKFLSAGCFLKSGLISSGCTVEFIYVVIFSWTDGVLFISWGSILQTSYSCDSGSFSNISDMDLGGSGYRQVINWLGF